MPRAWRLHFGKSNEKKTRFAGAQLFAQRLGRRETSTDTDIIAKRINEMSH